MKEVAPRTVRDNHLAKGLTPLQEAQQFSQKEDLVGHLTSCELDRLIFLKAFQEAVIPVLEKYLKKEDLGTVLEVGCGLGYFTRWLAPDWLKQKLVGFDVNSLLIKEALGKDGSRQYFVGNIYCLPLADQSIEAVIGYSSFDSFCFLTKAISEVKRVLKPKGRIILFQDLTTDLYQNLADPNEDHRETVERYHRLLYQKVVEQGLRILTGKEEDLLTVVAVERGEKIQSRIPDFEWLDVCPPYPMVAFWNKGYAKPPLRRSVREAMRLERSKILEETKNWWEWSNRQENHPYLQEVLQRTEASPEDLLQFVTMRYLVAEKT